MRFTQRHAKRIATDAAGYLLILAGVATGWLPGPGGIPLIVGGLGLLSINNAWAQHLRLTVLRHGGKVIQLLFPRNPWAEWGYDILVALLFALTVVLEIRHASILQVSLGASALFIALFVALTNRDRLNRLRGKHKRQ